MIQIKSIAMKSLVYLLMGTCRVVLSVMMVFAGILTANAASWVDVTDVFVKNPRYDGNSYSYWEGTTLSGVGARENAEHYYKYYDTYQTITGLQAGRYRVSLQAFYRMGNSASDYYRYSSGDYADYQYAHLYASSSSGYEEVAIVPASSAALAASLGGAVSAVGDNLYIPNNMEAAAAWFTAGYYNNSVECEVGEDGTLTIGISKYDLNYEDWTCIDNWRLEYYEEQSVTRITDLTLAKTSLTMAMGASYTMRTTILPSDATNKTLQWTSSDVNVATVTDAGKITAVKGGKAVITAATTDMSGISASCSLTVYNRNDTDASWIDVTEDYITNPTYANNDFTTGWLGTTLSGANAKENAEHYNKTYNTYQVLSGLPSGTYRLSLKAFYRMGGSENDRTMYTDGSYTDYQFAQLYATSALGDYSVAIAPASSGLSDYGLGGSVYWFYDEERDTYTCIPNNMAAANAWFAAGFYNNTVECEVGSDGILTIGIRKDSRIDSDWTCIDDWKLEYYGPVKLVTSVSFPETAISLVESETYQFQPQILPANAIYRRLQWTSSDASIVSVDANGLVTALNIGTATITATSTDGSAKSASCEINVLPSYISGDNVVINEIMAANVDVYLDPSWNYGSWVELFNPTGSALSLGGLYVTDDPADLKKHRLIDDYGVLPAHGYAIINFDHHEVWTKASYRQVDDKLSVKGETFIISDGTDIIAQQDYPAAISRVSYARTVDGGDTWSYTAEPTPGASNHTSTFATEQLPAPVVDTPAQLFSGTLSVQVTIPEGATLRYTLNGSAPTLTNGYSSATGQFTVSSTTCYRFRLFQDGKLPSQVVTRSYIEDNGNEPFPIISVVTDNNNIYGADYGVFRESDNGRPGNGKNYGCNWNMDWDRPVNFEYITTDNECVVSQECDFSMCGGWSRAWTPHAFKLKAKNTYDLTNTFDYQFFENKPFLKHKTLQIRNGGNDTSCRIKDGAIQGIVERSGIYVDYQSWKPVHVYINGSPYSVLNMREPNNKDFAYSNYGIDSDLMDQFEISPDSGYVQMRGTEDSFLRLYDLSYNASDAATYAEIAQLLDIDEYVNYMAIELYTGNWDWPQNNVKGFRDVADGKFHFVLFDLDGALSTTEPLTTFFGKQYYPFDQLYGYDYSLNQSVSGTRRTLEIKFVTIFQNMLRNEEFFKKFVDAYCLVSGSVFTPELTAEVVNERANILSQGNYVNPTSTANSLISGFSSRQNTLINHLQSYLSLDADSKIAASLSSNIDEARIMLNGMEVPTGKFNGKLFSPITLKAVAPAGYRFAGWAATGASSSSTIFNQGSSWKYYGSGSLDGEAWTGADYSDGSWRSGETPIGYDYNNQHPEIVTGVQGYNPTYYFRKTVDLSSVSADDIYTLDWIADDGFVVYVNGAEAGRYNMPSGTVSYSTYATTYAHSNPDAGTMNLQASLFHSGTNVIAVELHNNASNSTDIYWNAAFYVQKTNSSDSFVSTDKEYTLPVSGTVNLRAVWEAVPDDHLLASVTPVKINEVSAANSVYLNEYFKKNDWIELYNTTDAEIDIAGMYITDKLTKPQKYQIPEASAVDATYSTVIPPHGFLTIWADQLIPQTQIHTGFKLGNADDEIVMLTAADESWSDTLAYKMHNGNQSVGLYPDGGTTTYVMDIPTIGRPNIITSYATAFEQFRPEPVMPEPDFIREVTSDGDLRIAYSSAVLQVSTSEPMKVSVEVVNTAGQKVYTAAADVYGSSDISLESLPSGIYIAKVVSSNDNRCQMKFIKR